MFEVETASGRGVALAVGYAVPLVSRAMSDVPWKVPASWDAIDAFGCGTPFGSSRIHSRKRAASESTGVAVCIPLHAEKHLVRLLQTWRRNAGQKMVGEVKAVVVRVADRHQDGPRNCARIGQFTFDAVGMVRSSVKVVTALYAVRYEMTQMQTIASAV